MRVKGSLPFIPDAQLVGGVTKCEQRLKFKILLIMFQTPSTSGIEVGTVP